MGGAREDGRALRPHPERGKKSRSRQRRHPVSTIVSDRTAGAEVSSSAVHRRAELAVRDQNGLAVTLFWLRGTNVSVVSVLDKRNGEGFELVLEAADRALDVFHHPYAYAAARGLATGGSTRRQNRCEDTREEIVDV
jgi:hypothetical protein